MLVSVLPLPQRYYVPDRLRDVYRPRLEASGLWSTSRIEEVEKKKPFDDIKKRDRNEKAKYSLVFEREKVKCMESIL
jgi:sorting and assembly machinery component 37